VQRKVKVGSPGDAAEHEANRVAEQVASGPSSAKPTISRLETMQRKSSETSDAEHVAQRAEEDHAPAPVQRAEASSTTEPTTRKKEEDHAPAPVQRVESGSTTEPTTRKKEEEHAPAPVQRAEASVTTEPTARKKEEDHASAPLQRAEASSTTEPTARKKEEDHAPAPVQRVESGSTTEPTTRKKGEDHAPAPVQRAEASITTVPTARKKEEETHASLQRAEAHEAKSDATAQRCCCAERGGQNEQQQPAERPSGTASVYCKLHDGTPSPSENELNHSVRRKEAVGKPAGDLDAAATRAVATKDAGAPLRLHVLQKLESRMGADLSGVRVHEGSAAQESAAALQARAFTHKGDIWLGKGESQENTNLMAHEATHVVQQGAAVSRSSIHSSGPLADGPKHPDEEQATGVPTVRRSVWDKVTGAVGAAWDATGGKVVDAAGNAIAAGADLFWQLVKSVAPAWIVDLIQAIRSKGILGYLKDKLSGAFKGVFGGLSNNSGFIPGLIATFSNLVGTAHEIIGALGRGDCKPLFDAVSRLGDVLSKMAGDAWDKIKEFFAPVGAFFSDLWNKFGAPAVDFLTQYAADLWAEIKGIGQKLWDGTQPVRDAAAAAWKWVKDQLGIGEGPDGQNGLLQWVQGKLSDAWDWIKQQLQPVIGPMKAFYEKVKAILPLEDILNLREKVHEWLQHAAQMATSMRGAKGVTQNQEALRGQILPAVKAAIVGLRGKIVSAGSWVSAQIGGLAQTVTGLFASLRSNSILGALSGAIQWVQDKVASLATWVQSGVVGLFSTIGSGVAKLADFVEPVLNGLNKVVSVVANVVKELPGLVLGPIWKAIPACIRDPIKDFIIENILSQIPVISTFLKVPEIWGKIKQLVMGLLRDVFVHGDLAGAALRVFRFVLEAAGVNYDLMLSVLAKAASSLDEIIMHPVKFLGNLAGAVGQGLKRFVVDLPVHLATGLVNWLVTPLKDLGVEPIKDLSLTSILTLVMSVLGITEAKLRAKVEKAVGPKATKVLEGAWKWIKALLTKGLGGIWDEIKDQLSNLYSMVIGGISKWITTEIVEAGVAKLVKLCNPVGAIIEAIQTIYKTLTFLVQKANEILALVDSVLNSIQKIVAGDIGSAAAWIENSLARAVPMVIAFLAKWLGFSDPGPKVREIVVGIQAKVEGALDWLVEKAIAIGKKVMDALGLGKKPDERTDEEKLADLDRAMVDAGALADQPDADAETVTAGLPAIKSKYRLNMLELDPESGDKYEIVGGFSPTKKKEVELAPGAVKTDVKWGATSSTLGGTSMVAHPLTPKHGDGSAPSASPGVWEDVKPDSLKREGVGLYVRGHLLNQQLGGPGTEENLTPITYSANSDHLHSVEKVLKGMVNISKKKQQLVHYEVAVAPASRAAAPAKVIPQERQLTRGLSWSWFPLKATGDAKSPKLEKLPGGDSGFVDNVGKTWPHV